MTKGPDWVVVTILAALLGGLVWTAINMSTYKPKSAPITVTCEGDYKVFIRGDQFDVLFSEECQRKNVRPPLLGA